MDFERLTTLKGVRSFLEAASFYRKFCEGFSWLAAPLFPLLRTDQPLVWGVPQEIGFQTLKKLPTQASLLANFDSTKDLAVEPDAA